MRRLLAVLCGVALAALPVVAVAQSDPFAIQYNTCVLTTNAAVTCSTGAVGTTRLFVGVANNNTAAQTATVTCYAGSTSGTVVASIAALGATQVIIWPSPGKSLSGALVCQASSAPTGAGIDIYWR